jgi:regulator of replication initiation timing
MADFTIRSDQVDVEQIMQQIRQRIKEKRGVDYTEEEIRELASVKLDKFLDPRAVRSDLVQHYRRIKPVEPYTPGPFPDNYAFEDTTLYESHRGALRFFRRLLAPILKLFFNPNPLIHVLHLQGRVNQWQFQQYERIGQKFATRDELDSLTYEVMSNLVLETTKLGIETKNLRMRLESLSTRLDFDEQRARALEGVVQYRAAPQTPTKADARPETERAGEEDAVSGEGAARRRRRRRRGRRRGGPGGEEAAPTSPTGEPSGEEGDEGEPAGRDNGGDAPEPDRGEGGPQQ